MGVNPDLAGREYPPDSVYEVSREKIAEFATAIGSADPAHFDPDAARALGHPGIVAPPTFAVIIAQRSEARILRDPEAGIDYSRVVHGEEKFVHHRPIVVGDRPCRDARTSTRSARPAATRWSRPGPRSRRRPGSRSAR